MQLEIFDGQTFDFARDSARLTGQLDRVRFVMRDGRWRTLAEIAETVGGSEAGVSARLRDLRKERFGGLTVEREYATEGLWRYRVLPSNPDHER
jgi:hypothetical protein